MTETAAPSVISWQYIGMGVGPEEGAQPFLISMSTDFLEVVDQCSKWATFLPVADFFVQQWLIEDYVATAAVGEMMRVH